MSWLCVPLPGRKEWHQALTPLIGSTFLLQGQLLANNMRASEEDSSGAKNGMEQGWSKVREASWPQGGRSGWDLSCCLLSHERPVSGIIIMTVIIVILWP